MSLINRPTNNSKGKDELSMYMNTLYYYTRTKNILEEEEKKELFLFAGLTKKEFQILGSNVRKKVTPLKSKVIEIPLEDMPEYAKNIPVGTIMKKISKDQFETLFDESERDYTILFTFKT